MGDTISQIVLEVGVHGQEEVPLQEGANLDDEDSWADYMVSEMTGGEVTNISDARIDDEKITKAMAKLKCPKCGGHEWVLFRQTYGPERMGVFDAEMGEFFRDGDEMADLFIVCRNCEHRWGFDDNPMSEDPANSP